MTKKTKGLTALALLASVTAAQAQDIAGKVIDRQTGETLIGATVAIDETKTLGVTDIDGNFKLSGLEEGKKYAVTINYIGYKPLTTQGVVATKTPQQNTFALQPESQTIGEVAVTGFKRSNTETAMIEELHRSNTIVSNISAQEIQRSQDSNAGEVIRRVPGVSLIDDKFVMVRGLSQRYNNVWINGGAVPSSEADSRAFSFDIIPSSQIDQLTIIKTPSAEYPADYSGGFILNKTKDIPSRNAFDITVGSNWNDATAFKDFHYSSGSGTDFLGFDNGKRSLSGGMNTRLNTFANGGIDLLGNHFNNDWTVNKSNPIGDLKLTLNWNRRWIIAEHKLGLIALMNYSNDYRSHTDMTNNLFGIYDIQNDRSVYLRHSIDNQYNHNSRLGAMVNLTFLSKNGNDKLEWKNILNQMGNNRYTWRRGVNAQSDSEQSAEYYYRSRTTVNTQLSGRHTRKDHETDWSAGYAYANRLLPDRRRYLQDDALEAGVMALTTGNDISREWTRLDEHIVSLNINHKYDMHFNGFSPSLRLGAYGEYRTRNYQTREFIYNWNAVSNSLPADFRHINITELLSTPDYMGEDKLYMLEQVRYRNHYKGNNHLGAGYLTTTLPFGKLGIHAGIRFEHNRMELISNTRDYEKSPLSTYYKYNDLFPSVSTNYRFDDKNQVRFSYGKSINRPEFREVSSSVYYDFDLASSVQGNTELKPCYIHNIDLRYEFYPSKGETVSLAGFFKHFDSPIEWTYTVAGGTDLIYSYKNAKSASAIGIELDVRKNLAFIGMPYLNWSFNGSLIHSRVNFPAGSKESNRPMQGQSPYLINTGLFYQNDAKQLNIALLYNRIGKRIIGVGRSEGTTGSDENARIPDSYEMPRDVLDLTASKKFGKNWEIKAYIKDIFAQKLTYKQIAEVTYADGRQKEVEQITRQYKPGRNIGVSLTYRF